MSDWRDLLDEDERDRLERSDSPEWLAPMRATLTDRRFSDPGWLYERKFDGERLLTRNRKRAKAAYRHSCSRDWLKFKCGHGQELVIGGFTEPQGRRPGFGALLVRFHDKDGRLRYAGKVGTGYSEAFLIDFRGRLDRIATDECPFADTPAEKHVTWVKPEFVGEFGFTEWTRDEKLRHPRFLGMRRDKNPDDIVQERPDD